MGIDGSITGGSSQVLVLSVWDVEVRLRITVLLRQTEINHVDLISPLADAHKKVVGFDVAVDEGFSMDIFDSGNLPHDISQTPHDRCLWRVDVPADLQVARQS